LKAHETASPSATGTATARVREEEPENSREDRVDELRRQVQEGTYHVDAAELSSRIVAKHLKK